MIVAISSEMPLYVICRKLEYAAGASGVDIKCFPKGKLTTIAHCALRTVNFICFAHCELNRAL